MDIILILKVVATVALALYGLITAYAYSLMGKTEKKSKKVAICWMLTSLLAVAAIWL